MPNNPKLPFSAEAERALLGSILLTPERIAEARDLVAPSDFYSESNRLIFAAMCAIGDRDAAPDALLVVEQMDRDGTLNRAGGAAYIAALTDGVPAASRPEVREYAKVVKEKRRLRRLVGVATAIAQEAALSRLTPEEIIENSISRLLSMEDEIDGERQPCTFRRSAESLLRMLEAKNLLRVDVGIPSLDALTGGFLAGELVLFTAETGAGKTLLAQQMRRHACASGKHGLFASAEMTKEQLSARELARSAGVANYKMRIPERITPDEWGGLARASQSECATCEILDGEITIARVAAAAARMKSAGDLSFVVIDYDELVTAPGRDEMERHSAVATAAKSLARSAGVPVVLISQLRKLLPGENRRAPALDRVYGSGAKRKHAAIIVFAWRKYLETHAAEDVSTARLIVLKNRNGDHGAVDVAFDAASLSFRALTEEERREKQGAKAAGRPVKRGDTLPFSVD